ncbi:hypothetical protein [Clostridium sp. E02]|uniref:hypothetical protein n=1 Tax=Clostridium sp. E02 TaxID=2487134 RepID=UPI000F53BB6E|nr:hypothetical protein [Clostridium sp. E02]
MTEQEELLKLRALLAEKEQLISDQNKLIEKQRIQIENMIQALLHVRKKSLAHILKNLHVSQGSEKKCFLD